MNRKGSSPANVPAVLPKASEEWCVQKCGVVKWKMSLGILTGVMSLFWYEFPFQAQGKEAKGVCVWRWDRMGFLYTCFPICIWMCLLLTFFSSSVLFEEL